MKDKIHIPIFVEELNDIVQKINPKKYLDATFGRGGHVLNFLKINPDLEIHAFDIDKKAIEYGKVNFSNNKNIHFYHKNFKDIDLIKDQQHFDFILFDLGFSSDQIDENHYGLSYKVNSELDMNYSNSETNAKKILNSYTAKELFTMFEENVNHKFSSKLAKAIIEFRKNKKIDTTFDLNQIIENTIPESVKFKKNPFSSIYLALRIEVNQEFKNLDIALNKALKMLSLNGKIAVITFNSNEDKIVKHNFFQAKNDLNKDLLDKSFRTNKSKYPTFKEIKSNQRAKSAKLRTIIRIK